MRKITLLVLQFIPLFLLSQSKLVPGFIIKHNDDTLRGYLKEIPEKKVEDKILFTPNKETAPTIFSTKEVQSFGYEGGNVYNKVKYIYPEDLTTNERFAKKLVEGNYRLYMFWKQDKSYFIVNTYEDSTYLLYDDNMSYSGIISEKGNYKEKLLYLSVPCESLKAKVEYLNYNQTSMAGYVDRLNKCILPSEQNTIVYKKDRSYLNIFVYAGAMPLGSRYEFTGRIIGRFTIPSIDKNMSVNVGLNYMMNKKSTPVQVSNTAEYKNIEYKNIYSVPFTIQYNFIQSKIRPYIDAGLSLDYLDKATKRDYSQKKTYDKQFGVGFIIAAGIEGYITNRLMIKADWRYELFMHYPAVGIAYFLK